MHLLPLFVPEQERGGQVLLFIKYMKLSGLCSPVIQSPCLLSQAFLISFYGLSIPSERVIKKGTDGEKERVIVQLLRNRRLNHGLKDFTRETGYHKSVQLVTDHQIRREMHGI